MSDSKPYMRTVRSFVKREGKLTKGQQNAIDSLWPIYGVELNNKKLNFEQLFARHAPTILEIGFGNGLSLASMAEQFPEQNFFGVEVHKPGVGSCLVQIKQRNLTNLCVSQNDVVEVLQQQVANDSLLRAQIFFPDPWHKKRHHKRRLIQAEFVELLVDKLQVGGIVHVATDWQNYAEHILEVLSDNSRLKNTAKDFAEKPAYRPKTKYEERGLRLGHGVWDLLFEKQ